MIANKNFKGYDLSVEDIRKNLKIPDFSNIILLDTVNSTNLYAKELAKDGVPHGTVVIADHQTNGRGRLGRDFFSPGGTGIYMSILLRPDHIEIDPTFVTIMAGVAVCRAIESLCDKSPKIKWVNDIFVNNKKICGILAEAGTTLSGKIDYIILGIGLNVSTPKEVFPGELQDMAGSLFPGNITRSEITAEIINAFGKCLSTGSRDAIINQYKSRSLVLGKEIEFSKDNQKFFGTAIDINSQGNLIVALKNNETVTLKYGEITLRSSNFI